MLPRRRAGPPLGVRQLPLRPPVHSLLMPSTPAAGGEAGAPALAPEALLAASLQGVWALPPCSGSSDAQQDGAAGPVPEPVEVCRASPQQTCESVLELPPAPTPPGQLAVVCSWRGRGAGSPERWELGQRLWGHHSQAVLTRACALRPWPGGNLLFGADEQSRSPWVWDLGSGAVVAQLQPHPGPVLQLAAGRSWNGCLLAAASEKLLRVHAVSTDS